MWVKNYNCWQSKAHAQCRCSFYYLRKMIFWSIRLSQCLGNETETPTAKSLLFVTKYVITQKRMYVPTGPMKHSTTFWNVFSCSEKKLNTNTEVKTVVMMPLKKLAKLTFPSWHHIFNMLKNTINSNNRQHLFGNFSILFVVWKIFCIHLFELRWYFFRSRLELEHLFSQIRRMFNSNTYCDEMCQIVSVTIIWQADTQLNVNGTPCVCEYHGRATEWKIFYSWKKFLETFRFNSAVKSVPVNW